MVYHRDEAGLFVLGKDPQGGLWTPRMPVVQIPVGSAMAYAQWLRERTGQGWRLPTELEWEKVARGVDGRIYPWASEFQPGICHHRGATPGYLGPSDVGRYPVDQSVYGVLGLSGNIMEWCANPFPKLPQLDANIVSVQESISAGRQATRGGSWVHGRFFCRVDLLRSQAAWIPVGTVGFRIVRSI